MSGLIDLVGFSVKTTDAIKKSVEARVTLLSRYSFRWRGGLSWRDMYNLKEENLQTSFDGHLWIKTNRQKTGVESKRRAD